MDYDVFWVPTSPRYHYCHRVFAELALVSIIMQIVWECDHPVIDIPIYWTDLNEVGAIPSEERWGRCAAEKNIPNWDVVQEGTGCQMPYHTHGMKVAIVIQMVHPSEDKIAVHWWGNSVNVEYNEVFTLPPHSTWIPCGIHVIPDGFHPFHMEYVLGEISAILVIPSHMESTWNDMDSMRIPSFHMEFPSGFHMEPWNIFHHRSTWIPYGIMEFIWIPHGFQSFWH